MFNLDKNISAAIKVLEDENSFKTFNDYLVKFAPIFKDFLEVYLNNTRTTFETDKHKDCDKYLYDPFFEYSKNFGKLHRPLTCIAACLAANGGDCSKIDEVFPVAACIEDFQTAVLIHDDIADDGRIRRGRPCMHITYDKGLAINAGDFGLVATVGSSLEELKNTSYTDSKILKIVENLIFMEYMTIEGQAMDLGWAKDNRFDISEYDYITMATKKSAYYSASVPCILGAICADASDEIIDAYSNFGEKVGLAFQIRDDILNLVDDDNNNSNKDFRNDITEGKRTLIVCKALELCSDSDKNILIDILQSSCKSQDLLEKAVNIMQNCGALDYAKNFAYKLCNEAVESIKKCLPSSKWKDILLDMANWAKERKS